MKYFVSLFFICLSSLVNADFSGLNISSECALLVDFDSGAILYEKNAHKENYPASLTKLATLLYVIEEKQPNFDAKITASQEALRTVPVAKKQQSSYAAPSYWLEPDCSHMGLKVGETLSLGVLIYGLMLPSADDAANVIASYVSNGNIPAFMTELNAYLKKIGCTQTNFCNPHGLHHPQHKTTAYDLSIIARRALGIPTIRDIVKTISYKRPKTNKQEATVMRQTNALLKKKDVYYYPYAIGIKTGWTSIAGATLLAAAKKGERTLIAVILNSPDRISRYTDAVSLFETAFNEERITTRILPKGEQAFTKAFKGASKPLKVFVPEEVCVSHYPSEKLEFAINTIWKDLPLPIKKNDLVGEVQITNKTTGYLLTTVPIFANIDLDKSIIALCGGRSVVISLTATALIIIGLGFYFSRRRYKR